MSGRSEYRVALYTMGCRTNQYDSSRLAEELEASGFRLVSFDEPADVYVINTCTVTAAADREARSVSRRALARSPHALVVATGCYVQVDPRPMEAIPGIGLVGGNSLKSELAAQIRKLLEREHEECESSPTPESSGPAPHPSPSPNAAASTSPHSATLLERTRHVIKVQEGCNYRCAYCVVPHARGAARSRPLAEVVAEVGAHVAAGCAEVVLTGTCIGTYGKDLEPRLDLVACARAAASVPGIERVRISSVEPWEVEEDLIELMADHPVLCPHLHLPLQSGDDGVRRRMHRPGSSRQFADLVRRVRERLPEAAITTDVIVGYPGESDAEFAATYDFCREMAFSRMHVFRYSPRPFTVAARQPLQVPRAVQEARSRALIALGEQMAGEFAARYVGQSVRVLVEGGHGPDGLLDGLTGNFLRAHFSGDPALRGRLVEVEVTGCRDGNLTGTLRDKP